MRVVTPAELQLTNVTTIDGGIITNHGEIESVVGINTIKNVTGSNFTNNGTIEVVTGVAGSGSAPDTDPVNTLVLSNDYLTNSIGTNGTVLVETAAELQLTNVTTIDGGIITNHGEIESVVGINTIKNVTGSNFTNNGTIEVVTIGTAHV